MQRYIKKTSEIQDEIIKKFEERGVPFVHNGKLEIIRNEINGIEITYDGIEEGKAIVTINQIPKLQIDLETPVLYYSFDDGTVKDLSGYTYKGEVYFPQPLAGGFFKPQIPAFVQKNIGHEPILNTFQKIFKST